MFSRSIIYPSRSVNDTSRVVRMMIASDATAWNIVNVNLTTLEVSFTIVIFFIIQTAAYFCPAVIDEEEKRFYNIDSRFLVFFLVGLSSSNYYRSQRPRQRSRWTQPQQIRWQCQVTFFVAFVPGKPLQPSLIFTLHWSTLMGLLSGRHIHYSQILD